MGVKRDANIVIVGNYQVGKTNIATSFTNTKREDSMQQVEWSDQLSVSKEHDTVTNATINIKGSPQDFGRMSNSRLRNQTFSQAQAYIVVFHNTEKKDSKNKNRFPFEWYVRASEKKPMLFIGTAITEEGAKRNADIEKYVNSVGGTYVVINTTNLSKKEGDDYKLMERSIQNLVFTLFKETLITNDTAEKKLVTPGEESKETTTLLHDKKETPTKGLMSFFDGMGKWFGKKQKVGKAA